MGVLNEKRCKKRKHLNSISFVIKVDNNNSDEDIYKIIYRKIKHILKQSNHVLRAKQ